MNKSILILLALLFVGFIVKLIANKKKKKDPLMNLNDFFNILFNVTLFAGGLIAVFVSIFNESPFGEEFIISIPLINFIAGATLIVVSIVELWGSKNGKRK